MFTTEERIEHKIDKEKIARATRLMLEAIGEDPFREGIRDTPDRVARMYEEIFSGLREDPAKHFSVTFKEGHDDLILLKDVDFFSTCEHHLVPFFGKAHIAYIPRHGKVVGLSKLARVIDAISRRPQLQERITSSIADSIMSHLSPQGVMVIIEAEHMCMSMRGIKRPGSITTTSAVRGILMEDYAARAEVLSLLK